jgi:hypothetical protein
MSLRGLARLLVAYAVVLVVACVAMHSYASAGEVPPAERRVVVSRWSEGKLVDRHATPRGESPAAPRSMSAPGHAGETLVHETAVAEGPLSLDPLVLTFSLVPGRDGLVAELGDKTAFVTVDDLLSAQAYDHASSFLDPSLSFGTHRATILALLANQLDASPKEVEARARVRRVRFERRVVGEEARPRITTATLDREDVKAAVRDAASYLARAVDDDGRYRYLVDAVSDKTLGGYNWPRHAGATYFLAQAAALLDDATIRYACLRAAARMRDVAMQSCGMHKCIADDEVADVGSSALAIVAFSEIVRTGADASYRPAAIQLAELLKSQQRPDGELMHLYDRAKGTPLDVQMLYYTGEAALALARVHRITGDPDDLRAASRALSRLSGQGWSFFGSRYYFSEEHWTCQAMADLWERAPDPAALAFCLRWHEYQRRLQYTASESAFDADGAFGFGPFVTPRVTPAASRGEAAGAALEVMKKDATAGGYGADEQARTVALLDDELRRAIAFVATAQLRPGTRHLFARPDDVRGAFPGSSVDLQLRIDYVQHAGSMMIRWLELGAASHP